MCAPKTSALPTAPHLDIKLLSTIRKLSAYPLYIIEAQMSTKISSFFKKLYGIFSFIVF